MSCDWPTQTVAQLEAEKVLLVQDGNHGAYRPKHEEIVEEGTSHIRAADITDEGEIDFLDAQKLNDVAMSRLKKGVGAPGDVLLTHKGTVGRVARAPEDAPPFICSPQTTFWRSLDTSRLDQGFLHAYLRSPQFMRQLASRMHDSDMAPYVSLTAQRSFQVPVPCIREQRRIAKVVGVVDEKVALNLRMTQKLRDLVFTRFEHEIAQAGQSDTLGQSLTQIADFVNGKNFTNAATGDGRPVLRIRELTGGLSRSTVFNDLPKTAAKHVADFDSLLFSWSGTLGVFRWCGPEGLINQHIFKVLPHEDMPKWFVECWLRVHLAEFKAIASDKAVTMGHIRRSDLDAAQVRVPPPSRLEKLDRELGALDALRAALQRERTTLIGAQKMVLPSLFEPTGLKQAVTELVAETSPMVTGAIE